MDRSVWSVRIRRCSHKVHEVSCRLAIAFGFESTVEIGSGTEQMQQRPQRETPFGIPFESEIDKHMLRPRGDHGRR